MSINIVLYQPEIPANSGNIARLSVAAACELHLIRPLGYVLSDRYLKRAGLDYWPHVKLNIYDGLDQLIEKYPGSRFYYFSTKASKSYTEASYKEGDFLVFGPESRGLPEDILAQNEENALTIPMFGPVRSINLSTAVGVVVYEALRQIRGF